MNNLRQKAALVAAIYESRDLYGNATIVADAPPSLPIQIAN